MALTNEQKRQQSGRDMEFNRQQSGRNMEESRRASGRKMRDDLRALSAAPNPREQLPALPKRGGVGAARGVANYKARSAEASQSGGIASPLSEGDFEAREYYESSYFLSTDYLIAMEIKPLKSISMTDADGSPVTLNFAEPL